MRKILLALGILVLLGALSVAVWYLRPATSPDASLAASAAAGESSQVEEYTVPPTGNEEYVNNTYGFSLTLPEGFSAREMPADASGARTIVLEDTSGQAGVQISVAPFDENLQVLTEGRIQEDLPDMAISDVQSVEIGVNHTGLAFKSDNEAFDGASREVWFVFRGNLYQISTYERLDALLQSIFQTWKFF